jgi:hypothetical protein
MSATEATFSIWSKTLLPDRISQILDIEADKVSVRGADRTPPRGLPLAHGWHLISKEVNEVLVGSTIRRLLERIPNTHLNALRQKDPELSLRIALILSPSPQDFSLFLPSDLVQAIAQLGASLDIVFENLAASDAP